ncbi:TetR/AcrR family transcriptional regulator [Hoeflea sp. TYP-13]|uniref:TetR/AcrR family transcriptional regulator n=1 Tax=Hoeflea sp. TYP-13 TaxID=3230023 RepID=UPI0034C6CA96
MPYSATHKQETRARIVQCAHQLFNRHGFGDVSIDEIMAAAGLTRGGFYNHFKAKEDLYAETLLAYASRRREDNGNAPQCGGEAARDMVRRYISSTHLGDIDAHCPLMALPSDVAHAGPVARAAYTQVLEAMVQFFEMNLEPESGLSARERALSLSATCVGAMVLARTVDDPEYSDEICKAASAFACAAIGSTDRD